MNIEAFREFSLLLPGSSEDMPFGPNVLVFRVMGKMFALTGLDDPELRVNLKCDPNRVIELREAYPEIILPGYHMNKQHWNTVRAEELDDDFFKGLILHSYDLIVASLTAKKKLEFEEIKKKGSTTS
jgi:predicted DNA-binding protein (MmcQ/YjbR family)